jgi:cysteinyl-tRNA synthetase
VRYVRNNITVGHIVDDAEDGEDKIAKKHVRAVRTWR